MGAEQRSLSAPLTLPFGAAIVMLLAAVFASWPYGFYQLLRLVVCGASAYGTVVLHERSPARAWILGAIALLFNPLVPIHFERDDWRVIDAATAIALGLVLAVPFRKSP